MSRTDAPDWYVPETGSKFVFPRRVNDYRKNVVGLVKAGIDVARGVERARDRQSVWNLLQDIEAGSTDDPNKLLAVAEGIAKPAPLVVRMMAAARLGEMDMQGKIVISKDNEFGQGMLRAVENAGDFLHGSKLIVAAHRSRLLPRDEIIEQRATWEDSIPASSSEQDGLVWESDGYKWHAAWALAAMTYKQIATLQLPSWKVWQREIEEVVQDTTLKEGRPERIIRLGRMRTVSSQDGEVEVEELSLRTPTMPKLVATGGLEGLPRKTLFTEGTLIKGRNLTLLHVNSGFDLRKGLKGEVIETRWTQGYGMDALAVLSPTQLEYMRKAQEANALKAKSKDFGGLSDGQVVEQVPPSGLLFILSVWLNRVVSWQLPHQPTANELKRAKDTFQTVFNRINRKFVAVKMNLGKPVSQREFTVFGSYVGEYKSLLSPEEQEAGEDQIVESLALCALGLNLRASEEGIQLRTEKQIYELFKLLATAHTPTEDQHFFGGKGDDVRMETIRYVYDMYGENPMVQILKK